MTVPSNRRQVYRTVVMLYQYVYNSFEPLFKRLFHNFLHLTSKRAVQKWCQLGGGWVLVLQMMVPDDRRGGAYPIPLYLFHGTCRSHFPLFTSMLLYIYRTWMFHIVIMADCSETIVGREHNCLMLLCGLCLLWTINNYVALLQVLVELDIIQRPGSIFSHYFMIWFTWNI